MEPRRSPEEFELRELARFMEISGIRMNRVVGRIHEPLPENIAAIQDLLGQYGMVGFVERDGDGHSVTCAARSEPGPVRWWLHGLLLVTTVLTTMFVGALHAGANPLAGPLSLIAGWPFSLGIILVLGSHELAHYLAARRLGVDATPPYFLPVPHPMTGTMGAFIRIKTPVPSRSALVRVGTAGPLVGFVVAIPVTVIGLALSHFEPLAGKNAIRLGSPLLFELISRLLHGPTPAGQDLMLHPVAFAGWLGMFVTALNLLPVGQLDGGHVAYALLGRYYRGFSYAVIGLLLAGGLVWLGWPFWAFLATVFGLRHPPPLDDVTSLSRTDIALAVAALLVMIFCFMPAPFPAL